MSEILTDNTQDLKKAMDAEIQKASFSQSTGLTNFDLERPAKLIVPVLTPLRNSIPRVKANGGTQANWKTITAFDTANVSFGVEEGKRGGLITPDLEDYSAKYVGCGLESSFTFESEYAAEGFDNVRARNAEGLLKQTMIKEEQTIVGGLGTFGLGTTPTPVAAPVTGKGSMTAATVAVYCVALTLEGYMNSSVAAGLPGQITRTNADGKTSVFGGGNAKVSAASDTVTLSGSDLAISATVDAVPGAVAYAWFVGATAATAALHSITTVNAVTMLSDPTGSMKANDAKIGTDYSKNALVFDGLLSQAMKSGSGAYVKSLDGASLTSDGAGGIVEIDEALRDRWENRKLSPSVIYVNSQEAQNITALIVKNGGAPLFRFNADSNGIINLTAGAVVGNYLNKYSLGAGQLIPIKIHPYVPAGTILMITEELPYPVSNISNVFQMKLRKDYNAIEWPITSREYVLGVYFDGVLQHYAPFSMCVISNVGK